MKRESITLRIVFIFGVIVILIIPLVMIQSLITERQTYRDAAVSEINDSWAASQIVAGPILTIKNEKWTSNPDGKKFLTQNIHYFLPEKLKIDAELVPEKRNRGIYEVTLYKSKIRISGFFDFDKMEKTKYEDILTDLTECYLAFNVTDLKGIQDDVKVNWNNAEEDVIPGLKNREIFRNGFITNVKITKDDKRYNFDMVLQLRGSEKLDFIPIGKTTNVAMSSSWNNPSFSGEFLPSTREITGSGFKAEWAVNHFNRDFPQEWDNTKYDLYPSAFGVRLLVPVDEYQKTMRTSKYGIMIIILTFVSFFMIEIFNKKALHPIQYLLVGLSLVIFYSILLSISEYIMFQYSYIIAGVLVVSLISMYTASIYDSRKLGSAIGLFLILFYGFMYVILQLQDYSLLFGNIALFLVLSGIMFATRKISWYDVFSSKKDDV